jgi:serine phosphatase RsbU (regulator of sigma subunit)
MKRLSTYLTTLLSGVVLFVSMQAVEAQAIKFEKALPELGTAPADSARARQYLAWADSLLVTEPEVARHLTDMVLTWSLAQRKKDMLARAYNFEGILACNRAHYLTAIENYQSSLGFYNAIGDLNGAAMVTNNIGVVYSNLKEHRNAIRSFSSAAELAGQANRKDNELHCLFNVCVEYLSLGSFDTAGYKLAELKERMKTAPGLINTDLVEGEWLLENGQTDSALVYLSRAISSYEKEREELLINYAKLQRAECLMEMGRYYESHREADAVYAKITQLGFNEIILECLKLQAELSHRQGLHQQAFKLQKRYTVMNDSLRRIDNLNRVSELNLKYETEKNLLRMERLDRENKHKASMIRLASAGLGVLLVLIGFTAFLLAKKRKTNALFKNQNREINLQRQQVMASINYAKRIQESILIPESELKQHFDESFIYFRPRDIVSGDFYWFYRENDLITIAAVDCTGHGVPGAFLSLIASNKLRKVIGEVGSDDPSKVLKCLNDEIVLVLNQDKEYGIAHDGLEISLSVIDTQSKTITFAGSGGGAYVIARDGRVEELRPSVMALGGSIGFRELNLTKKSFHNTVYNYEPGDHLFMFTDGLMDQFGGPHDRKLNKSGFRNLIASLTASGLSTAKENCDRLLREWMGSRKQLDDILLIGMRL